MNACMFTSQLQPTQGKKSFSYFTETKPLDHFFSYALTKEHGLVTEYALRQSMRMATREQRTYR
jgi:hypothetical protein